MKRQFVLVTLLAVALAGFAKGQGTSEKKSSDVAKKVFDPMSLPVTRVISDDEVKSEKDKAAEKSALEVESQFTGSIGDRKLLNPWICPRLHLPRREMGTRILARQNPDSGCSHRSHSEVCEH